MPYRSLADFLEELENAGELVRIAAEVDPELELAEIVTQATAAAGSGSVPAFLFQNARAAGQRWRRICWALPSGHCGLWGRTRAKMWPRG